MDGLLQSSYHLAAWCSLAGLWFLIFVLVKPVFRDRSKFPRGPLPLGLLGNVFTFIRLQSNPDKELLHIRKVWGSLCTLWFGSGQVLVISTPKAAKEILNDRGAIYSSRPPDNDFRNTMWPSRIVTIPAGEEFRFLRKLYHTFLGPKQSMLFRQYQDFESMVTMCDLLDQPESFLQDAERFSMSVIFSATYGVRISRFDNPVAAEFFSVWKDNLKLVLPGSLLIDFIPVLQKLPLFLQPWHHRALGYKNRELSLHAAVLDLLRGAIKRKEAPECFAKMLLEVQSQEGLGEEQTLHILAMLIGAGADSTSSVLQGFFKIMALQPEAMKKARDELDRVVGPDRLPSWDDQPSLPYLRSLIKEVHRWGPIASLGIPHAATQDDVYEEIVIPKGTVCFPNIAALNQDPERYPEPQVFDPDRFMHDDVPSAASAMSSNYMKRDHYHYGFGRRLCPGILIAEASLFIFISRVIWGFDVRAEVGVKLNMKDLTDGMVKKPKPYKVGLHSRGPSYEKVMRDTLKNSDHHVLDIDNIRPKKLQF